MLNLPNTLPRVLQNSRYARRKTDTELISKHSTRYVIARSKPTDELMRGKVSTRGISTERREKSMPGRLIDFTVDRKSNDGSGWYARARAAL